MERERWISIPDVCDVTVVRGARSVGGPDLLLEVPHGATLASDFDALASSLRGPFPADLRSFFFVNTDVGAPEVARRVAERVVAEDPARCALVIRSRVPRTFIDCNRVIDAATRASASKSGEMTPGIPEWVRDPLDQAVLLARYDAYRAVASEAFDAVCGAGGVALLVHSYAPRSVDVPVDERIVEHLRAAYAPGKRDTWPLRSPVDLIVNAPDGTFLASERLASRAQEEFTRAGFDVARNGAYALHPISLAHTFAARHPGRTLCLELRRDLLVSEFTPFAEMRGDPAQVARAAEPLALAVLGERAAR